MAEANMVNRFITPDEMSAYFLDVFNQNTQGLSRKDKAQVWAALGGWLGGFPEKPKVKA